LLQAAAVCRQLFDCTPAPHTTTSHPFRNASAMRNSLCRVLLPPKRRPVQSSRLRKTRAPPMRSAKRGTSSKGVGRWARSTRGKRLTHRRNSSVVSTGKFITAPGIGPQQTVADSVSKRKEAAHYFCGSRFFRKKLYWPPHFPAL